MFSMLGNMDGLRVLDLYAGSGALGIEALSRGAEHATFVESQRGAAAVLRENLEDLGLTTSATLAIVPVARARGALAQDAPFDLVLCDPPWPDLDRALADVWRLLGRELLRAGALVVLEHPARTALEIPRELPFTIDKTRKWGDTAVTLLLFSENPEELPN